MAADTKQSNLEIGAARRHPLHRKGSVHGSLAPSPVSWFSAMVPQYQDCRTLLGFPIKQVVWEGREIGTPQHANNKVETARILLNAQRQFLELTMKPDGQIRPDLLLVMRQNGSEVPFDQPMED
jgi:hypothetical protein